MSKNEEDQLPEWGEYLRAAIDAVHLRTPAELARRSGVNESQISRWLRGIGQPDIANLRKIAPVIKRPMLELLVAAGHLSPSEAKVRAIHPPKPEPVDLAAAIEQDAELLPEAKEHLARQYRLLLRVAPAEPGPTPAGEDLLGLPHVARKRTPPSKRPR